MLQLVVRACVVLLFYVTILVPPGFSNATTTNFSATSHHRSDQPVTLDFASPTPINTFDPSIASDEQSITAAENLFLGLTDFSPYGNEILPELAVRWDVSDDGLKWTFHLRDDVMWVHYDVTTSQAQPVRPVVAGDFVYGIKRACDPRWYEQDAEGNVISGKYGPIIADVVAGCNIVYDAGHESATDDIVFGDTVQVHALNDTTLEIDTQRSAAYLLSLTTLPVMRPLPVETIDTYNDEWTQLNTIVSNGAYVLVEVTDTSTTFVRNPHLPSGIGYSGNIDLIVFHVATSHNIAEGLSNHELDAGHYCHDDADCGRRQVSTEPAVFYFAFNYDRPPFDNVHVRRAFSAIINRYDFVDRFERYQAQPMIHLPPPGINFAPPIHEVGVGFDPSYARRELARGGFPDCEGFPYIDIRTFQGQSNWADVWVSAAEEHLGCPPNLFNVSERTTSALLLSTEPDANPANRPHAWTLGWLADFPDAHNWAHDVLGCDTLNRFLRPCNELDDLIALAAQETDQTIRAQLYADIEAAFFGENGEFPLAPLFVRNDGILVHPWYYGPFETDTPTNGVHWSAYSINMDYKLTGIAPYEQPTIWERPANNQYLYDYRLLFEILNVRERIRVVVEPHLPRSASDDYMVVVRQRLIRRLSNFNAEIVQPSDSWEYIYLIASVDRAALRFLVTSPDVAAVYDELPVNIELP